MMAGELTKAGIAALSYHAGLSDGGACHGAAEMGARGTVQGESNWTTTKLPGVIVHAYGSKQGLINPSAA